MLDSSPYGEAVMKRSTGFTLIELMATMVVLAVLVGMAVPVIQSATFRTQGSDVTQTLYSTWLAGNRHALVTSGNIVICPGDDSGCRGGSDWSEGWIAFVDVDRNRQLSLGEHLIVQEGPVPKGLALVSTAGRTRLVVNGAGSSAGSNVTFTRCDLRGVKHAQTVVVANNGRIRQGQAHIQAAADCVLTARSRQ